MENFSAFLHYLLELTNEFLIFILLGLFIFALVVKYLIYTKYKCQQKFTNLFKKAVANSCGHDEDLLKDKSFMQRLEMLLAAVVDEIVDSRKDSSLSKKLFPLAKGAGRLAEDTIYYTREFSKQEKPDFHKISEYGHRTNREYNTIWSFFDAATFDRVIEGLPTVFVMLGIFSSFVSMSMGLDELRAINPANFEVSQVTLQVFIEKMGFSMFTMILSLLFACVLFVANTMLSPHLEYINQIDTFTVTLDKLYRYTYAQSSNEGDEGSDHKRKDMAPPPLPTELIKSTGS